MKIPRNTIDLHNEKLYAAHKRKFEFIAAEIPQIESIIQKLVEFNVARRYKIWKISWWR
jgi:L-rhamnose isomerase/sugar isomerase